jgi:hypothetical protein
LVKPPPTFTKNLAKREYFRIDFDLAYVEVAGSNIASRFILGLK